MIWNPTVNPAETEQAMRRRARVVERGRALRRRRFLVTAGLGAAALTGIAAFAATLVNAPSEHLVRTANDPEPPVQSAPPLSPVPRTVTGVEQTVATVALPDFARTFTPPQRGTEVANRLYEVTPGTLHAFSANGSEAFVVFDGTPRDAALSAPGAGEHVVGMYNQANPPTNEGDSGGFGILSSSKPLASVQTGATPAVFLANQWPHPGEQAYTWAHLPAGTAFVTYTWKDTKLWQRPVEETAMLVMPRLDFGGPMYSDWHTTPIPVLRAFDPQGNQLAQVNAPRVGGDDFGMSPDGPAK